MSEDFSKLLDDRKYEYLEPLGAGGFGVVIKVRHIPLDMIVAMKILHLNMAENPDLVERFDLEARAVAQLGRHRHICEALDYGKTTDGRPFFTMRFLEGHHLAKELRLRGGALPAIEAVQIALDVLDALQAAHKRGVIHRDVKPANIFLAKEETGTVVKVIDFGIAKIVQGDGTIQPRSKATTDGQVLGSYRYLAPEQAKSEGSQIDARTDLYAVGGVLFHMLTGTVIFPETPGLDAEVQRLLMGRAHVEQPPPHLWDRSAVRFPPALDAAIQKALAKDPADRHASAAAFAEALRAINGAELLMASPPPPTAQTAPPNGTQPIEHQRLLVEVMRRQQKKEEKDVREKRTVRIEAQARAQQLSRLRNEAPAWSEPTIVDGPAASKNGLQETLPIDPEDLKATVPLPPRRPGPQRVAPQGFSRGWVFVFALFLGLAFAAMVIALLMPPSR